MTVKKAYVLQEGQMLSCFQDFGYRFHTCAYPSVYRKKMTLNRQKAEHILGDVIQGSL